MTRPTRGDSANDGRLGNVGERTDTADAVDVAKVLDATNVHCKVQCLSDGAILNARYGEALQAGYVKVRPCHLVLVHRSNLSPGVAEVARRLASVATVMSREEDFITLDTGFGHPVSKRLARVRFRDTRPNDEAPAPIRAGIQVVSVPADEPGGGVLVIDTGIDGLPVHPHRVRARLLTVPQRDRTNADAPGSLGTFQERPPNPFLASAEQAAWGPGSLEMALSLMEAVGVRRGARVLEVGGGSGRVATVLAKHWDVTVVVLEPWEGGGRIQARAAAEGVGERVLALKLRAQDLGAFADSTFDAVVSIGSFEMIGDERPQALEQMVRVAKPGAHVGIAEPMCLPGPVPPDVLELDRRYKQGQWSEDYFRTVDWNCALFERYGLSITRRLYYSDAYTWWLDYAAQGKISPEEQHLIRTDGGRWLSLGLVVGQKPPRLPRAAQ